jgi:hypothetical protein
VALPQPADAPGRRHTPLVSLWARKRATGTLHPDPTSIHSLTGAFSDSLDSISAPATKGVADDPANAPAGSGESGRGGPYGLAIAKSFGGLDGPIGAPPTPVRLHNTGPAFLGPGPGRQPSVESALVFMASRVIRAPGPATAGFPCLLPTYRRGVSCNTP